MPELMVDLITSLDGCATAEGWPGWWGLEGPEYLGWLEEQSEHDYEVLEVGFFAADALPELDRARTAPELVELCFAHRRNPSLPTEFD